MKNIFGIQSHLTFYIAHRIIQLHQFNPDDCIFIAGRNYKIPTKYNTTYKHILILNYGNGEKSRIFSGINLIKTQKKIKQFDNLLDNYTSRDNYNCYIPYCSDDIANLLVTKKNCISYYIIEEGYPVYTYNNPKTFSNWRYLIFKTILKPLFPRLYAIKENLFYPKYHKFKGFYAVSSNAYPLFHNYPITIIGYPFETIDINFSPDVVISVDPFFRYLKPDMEDTIYHQLSLYIKQKKYQTIAYKLHPAFEVYPDMKIKYENILHKYFGKNIIQLDDTIVLENLLMTYKCDFYSSGSAVQIYGTLAGAKCYDFSAYINRETKSVSSFPFNDCIKEVKVLL